MVSQESLPPLVVNLQTLTVNLIGDEGNVQFVNPHTFYWNGAVDQTWVLQRGARIGFTQSSFSYTNGVQVEASRDTISFRQQGDSLTPNGVLSVNLAKWYANAFGAAGLFEVSVEFSARIDIAAHYVAPFLKSSLQFADHLVSHPNQPAFGTFAVVPYPDRTLRVDFSYVPWSDPNCLTCTGQVSRQLSDDINQGLSELHLAIDRWPADWLDVLNEASPLLRARLIPGGWQ